MGTLCRGLYGSWQTVQAWTRKENNRVCTYTHTHMHTHICTHTHTHIQVTLLSVELTTVGTCYKWLEPSNDSQMSESQIECLQHSTLAITQRQDRAIYAVLLTEGTSTTKCLMNLQMSTVMAQKLQETHSQGVTNCAFELRPITSSPVFIITRYCTSMEGKPTSLYTLSSTVLLQYQSIVLSAGTAGCTIFAQCINYRTDKYPSYNPLIFGSIHQLQDSLCCLSNRCMHRHWCRLMHPPEQLRAKAGSSNLWPNQTLVFENKEHSLPLPINATAIFPQGPSTTGCAVHTWGTSTCYS